MEKYKFKLEIGDWSKDGHSQSEEYLIQSNVDVKELREIYFKTKKFNELSLEDICDDYEDNSISEEQIRGLGLDVEKYQPIIDNGVEPDDIIELFIDYIQTHNPEIYLKIINDNIPSFHFYGFDEQKRHIGGFGYGLFS